MSEMLWMYPSRPLTRLFIVLLTACLGPLAGGGTLAGQSMALTNARVVDVEAGTVSDPVTVVIQGRRVVSLDGDIGDAERSIDLGGRYLAPGLIDGHVHISSPDQARRALLTGVTTARSMGAAYYVDVGLRDLQRAGAVEGPELLAAGYHVRPPAGDAFFMSHPELSEYLDSGIRGRAALEAAVEAITSSGVDFIKTNATERAGLPETDPRKRFYSDEELRIIVETAARAGVPVAAHAHGDEGGRGAVLAGVRSIEHGTYLSDETLDLMAERGTYLVPTAAIVTDLAAPGGDYDSATLQIRGRHMVPRIRDVIGRAYARGVKIVAATDTGYGPESRVRMAHELIELVGAGMPALDALRAATTTAAELLGVDDHAGRVAVDYDADLIVLEHNPLEDVGTLQDVLMVVSDGRVVVQRGDWARPAT